MENEKVKWDSLKKKSNSDGKKSGKTLVIDKTENTKPPNSRIYMYIYKDCG